MFRQSYRHGCFGRDIRFIILLKLRYFQFMVDSNLINKDLTSEVSTLAIAFVFYEIALIKTATICSRLTI